MSVNSISCTKCGTEKTTNSFFKSYSPLHESMGYVSVCKTCVYEIYNDFIKKGKDEKEAVIEICKLLDKPFIEDVFVNAFKPEEPIERNMGEFFKQVHMQQWRRKGIYRFEHSQFNKKSIENHNPDMYENNEKMFDKEWQGNYTSSEIEYLNNYLKGLHEDFKIITTNHKDYAKKIAQASLAMNKAYQDMLNGDSGADKRYADLQKVFDNLSKSAQFSENSRSASDVGITGISQIVDKVESKQWIYEVEDFKKDELDHILEQFSNINKSL